jgi:gliding motility-associated-like protein
LTPRIPSESMSGVNRSLRAGRLPVFLTWLIVFITIGQVLQAQPVAEFTASRTAGCAPLVVAFTDQSTGSPTSWNWGFSNGQLSSVKNPTITFSAPGTYSVSLVVTNADGTHGITKTDYITVYPSPTVAFTPNITTGCVPVTIQFTDNSVPQAGTITTWEWNFGDGNTSNQQNPQHTYTAVGFYNVSLRVTSSTGCVGNRTYVRLIRIVPGVTAQFANTPPVRCRAPFVVNFQNQTSGPGNMSYTWDFGNSATSAVTNPSVNYANAGTFDVKLVARSQFGCADSITKPVTLTEYTTAINSPDQVCLNTPVNFQNGGSPAPVSSVWTFGNGQTSTNIDGVTSYTTPGPVQVKLINRYATCIDSVPKTITVLPRPTVDFTAPELIGCQAPHTVNFQDISPDAVAWQWDFGDGNTSTTQNPRYTYQDTGRYTVTLTITTSQGCQNTITKTGYIQIIKPVLRLNNVPTGGCTPFTFTPSASVNTIDGVATWYWDYGDGFTSAAQNPPSHTYPAGARQYDFTLRITTNGGCTETLTIPNGVMVGTPPPVSFTLNPVDACAGNVISFTNTSGTPLDNWVWSFGNPGNSTSTERDPTFTYSDTGTFTVRLTGSYNRCQRFVEHSVHIKPPVAEFNFSVNNCVDRRQVNFTDHSQTDASYGPISYLWEFGDPANSTSNAQGNTSFTYPSIGDYIVRLTVTNGTCTHTFRLPVRLVGEVADFSVSKASVCRGEQVTFSATNSALANILQYEWSTDGGANYTVGGRNYATSFSANGSYNVTLRITDINGCQDVKTVNNAVTVTGPTANFTASSPGGCSNAPVTFNDLSTPAGSIVDWNFTFDDGTSQTFTSAPFTHTFADTGTYTIRLTVRDNSGCTSSFTLPDSIIITRAVAGFRSNYTSICPDVPMQFTDTSKGNPVSWFWDLGDGTTSTLQNPAHTYTGNDSNYTVKLVITDNVGCRDSVTKTNYISVRSPKPAFTVTDTSTLCPPIETKFTFQGRDYQSFYWDFGDGGDPTTQQNPSNFYNAYGTYTATLYMTGYGGCQASASAIINVYNPHAFTRLTYSPVQACNELTTNFSATIPPSTAWTVLFGDGPLANPQTPTFSHTYTRPGYYTPTIILKDSQDCQVAISFAPQLQVNGAIPLFGKDKKAFCDSGMVTFTNYTLAPNDPVSTRTWDFGDGTTSDVFHPVHTYRQPGTYIVSQRVTTRLGCENIRYDTIRVYGTPFTRINSDTIVCIDEILPLQGELIRPDTSVTWAWNLGNGSTSADTSVSTSYGTAGFYNISLITSNLLNCRDTTHKAIYVPDNPVISIEQDPTIVVGNGITMPVTYSDSIITWTWAPPTRLDCTDCPMPYANPQFTTTYKISVEDIYGCKASRDITVTVICNQENYYIPNTFSPNGDGMNDIFAPRGKSIHRVNSMKIFNRWGELVWERRNFMVNDRSATGGWDGTFKGKPAQQDVYVYIIELVCDNAQIIPYKGNVTLIR